MVTSRLSPIQISCQKKEVMSVSSIIPQFQRRVGHLVVQAPLLPEPLPLQPPIRTQQQLVPTRAIVQLIMLQLYMTLHNRLPTVRSTSILRPRIGKIRSLSSSCLILTLVRFCLSKSSLSFSQIYTI